MKLALILVGGAIILAVVISAAVTYDREKARVAEFYERNSNAAILPGKLQPELLKPVEGLGFLAGGLMVLVSIYRSRAPVVLPSA